MISLAGKEQWLVWWSAKTMVSPTGGLMIFLVGCGKDDQLLLHGRWQSWWFLWWEEAMMFWQARVMISSDFCCFCDTVVDEVVLWSYFFYVSFDDVVVDGTVSMMSMNIFTNDSSMSQFWFYWIVCIIALARDDLFCSFWLMIVWGRCFCWWFECIWWCLLMWTLIDCVLLLPLVMRWWMMMHQNMCLSMMRFLIMCWYFIICSLVTLNLNKEIVKIIQNMDCWCNFSREEKPSNCKIMIQ